MVNNNFWYNFLILFIVIVMIFLFSFLASVSGKPKVDLCKHVCQSHHSFYYNLNNNGFYQNSVCLCKSEDGVIDSFVL